MLVIAARDDVVKRRSISLLHDIRSLTPDRKAFDAFLRDVAAALRVALKDELAGLVDDLRAS